MKISGLVTGQLNMRYFDLVELLWDWLNPMLETLFGKEIQPVLDRSLGGFIVALSQWLWEIIVLQLNYLFYNLFVLLLFLLDLVAYSFDIMIGTQPIQVWNGKEWTSEYLFNHVFFGDGMVTRAFWAVSVIAVALTVTFAIVAVVRSMMDLEGQKPIGKVLGLASKSIISFLLVPAVLIATLNLSTVVLTATADAISGKTDSTGKTSIGTVIYSSVIQDAVRTKVPSAGDIAAETFSRLFVDAVKYTATLNPSFLLNGVIDLMVQGIFAAIDAAYDPSEAYAAASSDSLEGVGVNSIRADIALLEPILKASKNSILKALEADAEAYGLFYELTEKYEYFLPRRSGMTEGERLSLQSELNAQTRRLETAINSNAKLNGMGNINDYFYRLEKLYDLKYFEAEHLKIASEFEFGLPRERVNALYSALYGFANHPGDEGIRLQYEMCLGAVNAVIDSSPKLTQDDMKNRIYDFHEEIKKLYAGFDAGFRNEAGAAGIFSTAEGGPLFRDLKKIQSKVTSNGFIVGTPQADEKFKELIIEHYMNGGRFQGEKKSSVLVAEVTSALGLGYMPYLDSAYNTQMLRLENVHAIVGIICVLSITAFMVMAAFIFVRRLFEIMLLYIVSPYFAAATPLDDGQKFKAWRDMLISKMISGFGIVISMRLFLLLVPIYLTDKIQLCAIGFVDDILRIVLVVATSASVYKANTIISEIVNPGATSGSAEYAAEAMGRRAHTIVSSPFTFAPKQAAGVVKQGADNVQKKAFNAVNSKIVKKAGESVAKLTQKNQSYQSSLTQKSGDTVKGPVTNLTNVNSSTQSGLQVPAQENESTGNNSISRTSGTGINRTQYNPLTKHNDKIPPNARKEQGTFTGKER